VQACYFLTGENKQYNRSSGVFGRNIPNENAAWVRGRGFAKGAWQVGVRYSYLDLNSGLIQGGQVQDLTWALNWNLTPNCRLMLNYVTSYIDNAAPGTYPGTTLSLNGSKFTGQTQIGSLGTRLDYSF
jgi:phosphate-selective porin OprO/OprP